MATISLSRFHDINDLNDHEAAVLQLDYRPDLSHATGYPIVHLTQPFIHNQKEVDIASDLLNSNNSRLTFTEFLTDNSEHYINEAYEFTAQQHNQQIAATATSCSSPESDYSSIFTGMEDNKIIKMEYPESIETFYMERSLSVDSNCCPELAAVCNPASVSNASLSPTDSPLGQSPIMSPGGFPPTPPQQHQQLAHYSPYNPHCQERQISEMLMTTGHHHHSQSSLLIQDQNFQSMVSSLSAAPTTVIKAPVKSRGRRMINKPTKPGTKCFECSYTGCGRVFKRSEHLKRHVRSIHTLERPFHCPYPHCSKRFSRSDNLSQHLRVHRPNGKDKYPSARIISNFTPFLQTYHQNGNLHSSIAN